MHCPESLKTLSDGLVSRVSRLAADRGASLYLVGGYIRDAVLGKLEGIKDLDFAVADKEAIGLARGIADTLEGHFVLLDESNDTARVVLDDGTVIDFAGCLGGTIETDLLRRDFTINSLAWSASRPDVLLDPTGGMEDIERRLVRAVSEKAFEEDPLRLLRAFRFSARLGFDIEKNTMTYIEKHRKSLAGVAVERINYELFALLSEPGSGDMLERMGALELLDVVFPELTECRQVTANAFHHLGLFDHSIEAVRQMEMTLPDLPGWVRESADQELSFGVSRLAATKLACLLHDIGKPATWSITEEGRHTFYGHDGVGADMAEPLSERMKWSRPVTRLIIKLIKWHLRPGQLFHQGEPSLKAVSRFYRNVGDDLPELMMLAYGDLGATRGDGLTPEVRGSLSRNFDGLLSGFVLYKEQRKRVPRLLNGRDIMSLLSLQPGPAVGDLLDSLDDAQAAGEVQDRLQAEDFVRDLYEKKYSG